MYKPMGSQPDHFDVLFRGIHRKKNAIYVHQPYNEHNITFACSLNSARAARNMKCLSAENSLI